MLQNYLKIAWRNIIGNKMLSAINLTGLAIGMCVCFFATMYVRFELSYDRYHEKADHIYRLVTDVKSQSGTEYKSSLGGMAPLIQQSFADVKATVRIFPDYLIIQKDRDTFDEEHIAYADSSIFSVFTLPLVSGDPASVLSGPDNIVLSETAARKYFGDQPAVGKSLVINGHDSVFVTGVMKDMPMNSHFRTDFLVSMKKLGPDWNNNWKRFFFYTYLVLDDQVNVPQLNAKITQLVREHTNQTETKFELFLEPLKIVYLEGKPRGTRSGTAISGSRNNVYVVSVISLIVLFISCFNFVNLTTAYSVRRMKEIGVRKVLGGRRKQLIFQFLLDSVMISIVASFIAVLLIFTLSPAFNTLVGKAIITDQVQLIRLVVSLLPAAILVGILAGAYPSFYLSGMLTVNSLKGKAISGKRGFSLSRALVVTQFSVSIILIIATGVVYTQLDFMRNHEPGFKKDHVLVVDFQFDGRIPKHSAVMKQAFEEIAQSQGISMSSSVPGKINHTYPTKIENSRSDLQEFHADAYFIDHDFLKQYEIPMAAGRPFSAELSSDSTEAMLINEAACKALGFASPEQALGKKFEQLNRKGLIIGVTKDFHFHSFQEKVRPLTFRIAPGFFTHLSIALPEGNTAGTIDRLQKKWSVIVPGMPFLYFFADEAYHAQYVAEERFGSFFAWLAGIAIFLSCLGLLGLSALNITQRTKEIGLRKVLGASVTEVVGLLTRDFLAQVIIALIVAIPIGWYLMNQWLQTFAYRMEISGWIFVIAGLVAISVSLLTVSFQSVRAALMNPIESLKSE